MGYQNPRFFLFIILTVIGSVKVTILTATDLCPFDGDWKYHNSTGTCMSLQRPAKDYFDAIMLCSNFNGGGRSNIPGHLVYIFDKETDDFVKDLLDKSFFQWILIGLNDRRIIARYTWGETRRELGKDDYQGWAPGQPSDNEKSSVFITDTGWKERDLYEQAFFMCQVDAVVPIPTIYCPPSEDGQRSSKITCAIQFPDSLTPSNLRFQRAGRDVNECNNARCQNDDGYESSLEATTTSVSSVLEIKKVQRDHEGNWTCSVKFTNGQNITSEPCGLQVYTPPRVLTLTINQKEDFADVEKGAVLSLRCTATGYPPFQLSLLHDQGGEQTLKTVSSSEVSHILKATCHSMGRYTCKAERSVQQDVKHVNLRVRCGPVHCLTTFGIPEIRIAVGSNKSAKMCVLAFPAPTSFVMLAYADHKKARAVKTRYEASFNYIDETTGRGEITLTLFSVEQRDLGVYELFSEFRRKPENSVEGFSLIQFKLIELDPPSCPENLTLSKTFHDSITLSWKPGFGGGLQQSFTILRHDDSGSTVESQPIPQPAGKLEDEMSYNVTGLSGSTTYTFRLRAKNEGGVTECGLRVKGSTIASPSSSSDQNLTLIVVIAVFVLALVITVVVFVFVLVGRRRARGVVLNTDIVLTPTRLALSPSRDDERVADETIDDMALTEGALNTDVVQTATSNGRPSSRNDEQNAYETANDVPNTDKAQIRASGGRPSDRNDEQNAYETPNGGWLPEEVHEPNNEEAVYLNTQDPEGSNTVEGADQGVVYANTAASDNIGEGNSRARDGVGASNYDCLNLTEDAFDDDGTYIKINVNKVPAGYPQSEGVDVTEKSLYTDVI